MNLNKINKGAIYKNQTWQSIFDKLSNNNKSWWIEKVFVSSDTLLSDDKFSHYQLKCEEGLKNKIPSEFNEYIEKTFNTNDRYITELKGA